MPSLSEAILAMLSGRRVAIMVDYIVPLNVGTSGYTEYVIDPVKLFQVYDAFPELEGSFMGHVHSHNNMAVYFSGTDNEQLEDGANSNALFVSMIVNNKSDVTAKASIALGINYTFGDTVVSSTVKSVVAYPTKLLFGGSQIDDTFSSLSESIQKGRAGSWLFAENQPHLGHFWKEKEEGKETKTSIRNDVDKIFGTNKNDSNIDDIIALVAQADEDVILKTVTDDSVKTSFCNVLNEVADFDQFSGYMGIDEKSWKKSDYGMDYNDFMIMLFNMYMELFKQSAIAAYVCTTDDRFSKKDLITSFFSIIRHNDIIDLYTDTLYMETSISNQYDVYNTVVLYVDKMLKYAFSKVVDILDLTAAELKEFKIASVTTRYIIISDWLKKEDRTVTADLLIALRLQRNSLIEEINGSNKSKNEPGALAVN